MPLLGWVIGTSLFEAKLKFRLRNWINIYLLNVWVKGCVYMCMYAPQHEYGGQRTPRSLLLLLHSRSWDSTVRRLAAAPYPGELFSMTENSWFSGTVFCCSFSPQQPHDPSSFRETLWRQTWLLFPISTFQHIQILRSSYSLHLTFIIISALNSFITGSVSSVPFATIIYYDNYDQKCPI